MTVEFRPEGASILAFCGSTRAESLNAALLGLLVDEAAAQGARVTALSLKDYPLPVYDGDIEARGEAPGAVAELRELIRSHDALLIACPEHNGSVTALLKNTLDWCSRPVDGAAPLEPFQGKPVLIAATSPSPFGGLRAIGHLRAILAKMGAAVLPLDLAVPQGAGAFDSAGFRDKGVAALASGAVAALIAEGGR